MHPAASKRTKAFVEILLDQTKLERGLKQAQAKLRNFGSAVTGIGKTMVGVAALAATPIILSTKTFADFDDEMRMVKAVTGATGKEFQNLTAVAEKLGRETCWVAKVMPTWSAEDIRGFLDGRPGRHLADEVHELNGKWELLIPERWLRSMYEYAVEVGITDKPPGLELRLEADKELRKAVSALQNIELLYQRALNSLPDKAADTLYTEELRDYVEEKLGEIRTFLNNL